MPWIILMLAGLCETFAVAMINQFSVERSWQTLMLIIVGLGTALGLLSYSLQTIPMGTGYAIWTGISVVGSAIIGMIYFGESRDLKRLLFIMLILCSTIGLKIIT